MKLYFYKISDDKRTVFKSVTSANLIDTLTGNVKNDTDVMNPTFEISFDNSIFSANYVHVPAFGRYYFITEPPTVSTQRMFIKCHVDVLMTYHGDIDNLNCVIARQENANRSNLYLNDGMWRNLQPKETVTFSTGYSSFDSTGSYILAVGGKS